MLKAFRVLVMWLMAVAMPLQGLAASVMPHCGPPAHGLPRVSEGALPAGHALAHHAPATQGGTAVAAHHGAAVDLASAADAGSPAAGHAPHGTLKCCSTVGAMAAMTATPALSHSPAGSALPAPCATPFYPGVILDGLDRPPRALVV